jgi:predicted TIM-barrel fold metal-dependent hydrolase
MIDSHFHIWKQTDLPWLMGPMQPRIFGPYEPIRRDYPISEFMLDSAAGEVTSAVYVQANWAAERALDEVSFVAEASRRSGFPIAIVAYADMLVDDVRPQLDALAKERTVRVVRMQLHWHENPLYRFAREPDLARSTVLQRNVAHLAERGWSFDLQVFSGQMLGACDLAEACPGVTFVLQHAGMLEDTSAQGIMHWRTCMAKLAKQSNIVSKLSGLGTFIRRNDPAHIAMIIRETVNLFGANRCLFGSNFPIEKLWTSYADLIGAHRAAIAHLSPAEQAAITSGTARRVYRLN